MIRFLRTKLVSMAEQRVECRRQLYKYCKHRLANKRRRPKKLAYTHKFENVRRMGRSTNDSVDEMRRYGQNGYGIHQNANVCQWE